jgi:hypothetical protein
LLDLINVFFQAKILYNAGKSKNFDFPAFFLPEENKKRRMIMAKKILTIKGITFPKFSAKSSKRNFRLIFYIAYTDAKGKTNTAIVTKPATGEWQWRKPDKEFYLAEKKVSDDSVELDVAALSSGENGFDAEDSKIIEVDGEVTNIAVQFIDVFDASVGDFLKKKILPEIIEKLKATGFNPIDLLPVPGIITGFIKEKVKIEDLADDVENFLKKEKKDKLLHRISKKYNGKSSQTIGEKKEWEKGKTGTYGVKIGFE